MTSWDNPPNAAGGGGFDTWKDGGDALASDNHASMNQPGEETNDHRAGGHACFNCGQEGHNKADCPNPRVFTGECRVCNKEGHMAKDCPDKPAQVCKNCEQEGHVTAECTNQRKLDRSNYPEVSIDTAWANIRKAIEEQDVDDIKAAVQQYCQASPTIQYPELESAFRSQNLGLFLIAIEKPAMLGSFTNMDLQGNLNKKYTVSYRFSNKPDRPREVQWWPKSPEENLERLKDAGEVTDRRMPKCGNCDKLGHIAKSCPEEKIEKEHTVIQCVNCSGIGHRSRDCPEPRVDKFACKNCGQSGHKAVDCPEPRKAGPDVECRKCGEKGHFSRDCPEGGGDGGGSRGCYNCGQEGHSARDCPEPRKITCRNCEQEGHRANECPEPKNMAKVQCRNCDEFGHTSRDCPKPRDYSRIQCSNCSEMGHTKVRCTQVTAPIEDGFGTGATEGFKGTNDFNNAAGFNNGDIPKANDSTDAWQVGAAGSSGGDAGWSGGGGGDAW